jgi:hypothetical protein
MKAVNALWVMGEYCGPMLEGSAQAKATFWYGLHLVQDDLSAADAATKALGLKLPPLTG